MKKSTQYSHTVCVTSSLSFFAEDALSLNQSNHCWNIVSFTVCSACHHVFTDALKRFNGIVVILISSFSVVLSNKFGVSAFFRVVCGLLDNKSLAFTVGVLTVAFDTGVIFIFGVCIDCTDFAVGVTFGVSVTLGVSVLHACVAVEEAAICFCFSFTSCCIFDCMLDFRFATFAIICYVQYKL